MLFVLPVAFRIVKSRMVHLAGMWVGCVRQGMPQEYRREDLLENSHMKVVVG
jgi:hypothetical protein